MHDKTNREVPLGDLESIESTLATARLTQPAPARSAARPTAVPALVIAVVLLLGLCGYLLYSQQQQAITLAALAARSQASVDDLASEVSNTSSTLQNTDDEVRQSLKSLALQLRNLEQSQAALHKTSADSARLLAANRDETRALSASMDHSEKARQQIDAQQETRIKSLGDGLDAQAAKQKALADNLARLERNNDVAQLRNELNLLAADLREARNDYDRRLRAGEQATASSDAFRRQVNATLERINQQVSELYQRR